MKCWRAQPPTFFCLTSELRRGARLISELRIPGISAERFKESDHRFIVVEGLSES
jgi:hypothetical protein